MIYLNEKKLDDLKHHIIKDFKDIIPDIEEDCKSLGIFDDTVFYTWIEEGRLLGYMGVVRTQFTMFCSYTKVHNKKINRYIFNKLKEVYNEAELKQIPLVTDETSIEKFINHTEPIEINGVKLNRFVF